MPEKIPNNSDYLLTYRLADGGKKRAQREGRKNLRWTTFRSIKTFKICLSPLRTGDWEHWVQ